VDYYEISENKWLDEGDRQRAIDRILEKQQQVEEEDRKTRIVFDALSGQFVRQEVEFSEEDFRKEGRQFLEKRELEEKQIKETQAKGKVNWDERMLRSEKMKDLCGELLKK
jgi:ribosomal protein L22